MRYVFSRFQPANFALLLLMAGMFCSTGAIVQAATITDSPLGRDGAFIPVVNGEVFITVDKEASAGVIRSILTEYGFDLQKHYAKRGLYLLRQNPKSLAYIKNKLGAADLATLVRAVRRDARVVTVEPNAVCFAEDWFMPDDPNCAAQWNLTENRMLDMPTVWAKELGDENVIIAILDSGVAFENYSDAEFDYQIMPDFNPGRFVAGYDFINNDEHANDDNNHGTHVAGIICAGIDNGKGISGIAAECSIMPVKILDSEAHGSVLTLIQGLDFAVANGADIINMSVSFPMGFEPGAALQQAITDAHEAGVILVAAAGNLGLSEVSYPAAFNECIAVGAVNSDKKRAEYSNWGAALDIMAPGGDSVDRDADGQPDAILSTAFAEGRPCEQVGYWFGAGTSQAAAHVSAVAALLLSNGAENSDRVRNAILKMASKLESNDWDELTGYGLIDPEKSLKSYAGIIIDPVDELDGYVAGQTGTAIPYGFAGLLLQFPDRIVLFQESPDPVCAGDSCWVETRLYALVEVSPLADSIAIYEVSNLTLEDLVSCPGGPIEYITSVGGILQFLNDTGGILQFLNDTGGILMFLDDTGGLLQFLNDTGGLLQFLNDTGGLLQFLNDTGGIIMFLNDTGGFLGYFDTGPMLYAGCLDVYGNSIDPLVGVTLEALELYSADQ